jgi:hypothetical protein
MAMTAPRRAALQAAATGVRHGPGEEGLFNRAAL